MIARLFARFAHSRSKRSTSIAYSTTTVGAPAARASASIFAGEAAMPKAAPSCACSARRPRKSAAASGLSGGAHFNTGYIGEIGIWGSAFNSTQYGNMHTNQSGYWGTP